MPFAGFFPESNADKSALFVKPEQTPEFYKYAANILNLCDIEHMSSAADCEFHHNLERKKKSPLGLFF